MESKDELKERDIKSRTCYYFDDIIRFWDRDIDFSDILLDVKLYLRKRKCFNLWHSIKIPSISLIYDISVLQQVQNHWVLGSME